MTYHLAIDIGASSGRHILGFLADGKLCLEEIYRFENCITEKNGTLVWDTDHLVREVKKGISECEKRGMIPKTVAIDTWGVDYVLLDENKKELFPAVAYRDSRTSKVIDEIEGIISEKELFERTGIQKQFFNTVYQLYCDKKSGKLQKAKYFLMMPDYIAFRLTGVIKNEYTIASTTGLVNAETKTWDEEILGRLGINTDIFSEISLPCTKVGELEGFGFKSEVVLAPSHDTASAVAACPIGDNGVYISSGTWSLIGAENTFPVLSDEAMLSNLTNEGGIDYRYRLLKNIMGMWLFQNIRSNLNKKYSYDEMMRLAMECPDYGTIDTNAPDFISPDNMINAIRNYLKDENADVGFVLNTVYHSLAKAYNDVVLEIEKISGKTVETINIVGGGSKDIYLDKLTAQYTRKRVLAGPVEATATGNIISQMMYCDKSLTLENAREIVKKSFEIKQVNGV